MKKLIDLQKRILLSRLQDILSEWEGVDYAAQVTVTFTGAGANKRDTYEWTGDNWFKVPR